MDSNLNHAAIEEFRTIWKRTYGTELDFDRAREMSERLLSFAHQIVTLADRADAKMANLPTSLDVPGMEMAQ